MTLQATWEARLKLSANAKKLRAEGLKLWAKGQKLWAEGHLRYAESDKLSAESDFLWAEAIIKTRGNVKLEWKNWNEEYHSFECHLETGEVFGFPKKEVK